MSSSVTIINTLIRNILELLDRKADKNEILGVLDQLDNQFDFLVQANAPERITDERFEAAVKAIDEVSEKVERLRETVASGRYHLAKKQVFDLQASIRKAHRILLLVRAGAPTPMIFQVSPQFLKEAELKPPEEMVLTTSPLATQIYGYILRKGKVPIDELAREFGVTDKTRDEFNRAVASLIQRGFVKPVIGADNRMVLQAVR